MRPILLVLLVVVTSCAMARKPVEIFVSPAGNDNNQGTFATPERARDKARELKKPVNIFFRGGVYRLTKPLVLTPEDSGEKDAPVIYSAYKNEKVIFSGSQQVFPEWKKYNDHLFVAKIKLPLDQGFSPRTLYINQQACPLARYPYFDLNKKPFGSGCRLPEPRQDC